MTRVYCVEAESENSKKVSALPNLNSYQSYERHCKKTANEVTIQDERENHLWLSYQRMEKFEVVNSKLLPPLD